MRGVGFRRGGEGLGGAEEESGRRRGEGREKQRRKAEWQRRRVETAAEGRGVGVEE